MSFYRSHSKIEHVYNISGATLKNIEEVRDLGIILDTKLDFRCHYDYIINKALKMLGFVCRVSKDFSNVMSIKCLYTSLVRSILEYGSVVWSPTYESHITRIEKVQNKFLRFIAYKLNLSTIDYSLRDIRAIAQVPDLQSRRYNADLLMLWKILNFQIDCPDLLSQVCLHVPPRDTRSIQTFAIAYHRCNYGIHSPISRIIQNGNKSDFDFFNISLSTMKLALKRASFDT